MRLTRRSLLAASALMPFLHFPARAAAAPGILKIGLSTYPTNLQPWSNPGNAAGLVLTLLHRGLLSFSSDGALQGELAESWESDTGVNWTFRLRKAAFQNGAPVTAAAVKWNLEQIAKPTSGAYMRTQMQNIERIETPDDRTVRIVMKQPTVTLPEWLATFYMPIVEPGSVGAGKQAVGAGPYVLKASERGVSLDLVASDHFYRQGEPKIKAIRIVSYSDENLRVTALETGDVDFIDFVPSQGMGAIEKNPKLALDATDGAFMYLTFNGTSGPFSDPRIRQAVAFAIKREEVVQTALFDRGSPLRGMPLTKGSTFFDETRANFWNHDPARSKALLAQAGVPNGFACTLLSIGAQYGMHKSTAEVVQQNLAAVGIQVQLNLQDLATRVNLGNRGQYEFSVAGSAMESNDPHSLASLISGSLAPSYVRSPGIVVPKIDELLASGRQAFDLAKRKAIYAELEKIALDQTPIVGLAWRSQAYGRKKSLVGFRNLPGALTFQSGITLAQSSLADATE